MKFLNYFRKKKLNPNQESLLLTLVKKGLKEYNKEYIDMAVSKGFNLKKHEDIL